ncbi:MAG TPA: adenylosuccinate synthetase [Ktedonosporobacter sp.]|jgi:adenylosuccinate synthase|nr:adenylosuccinate synthetase [Ktedonosporobacter sp.]
MSQQKQAILIADLGFGDAGKGTITDFLTRRLSAHTVVRYNGGPQAAHNVVTPDGRHHTFSQFGSGMFLPRTATLLSRFMLINPLNMLKEERHLSTLGIADAFERTLIDRRALVITPLHKAMNRLRELARAGERHGSCGEGVGECMADSLAYGDAQLFAGDLQDRMVILRKLHSLYEIKRSELDEIRSSLPDADAVKQELAAFTRADVITDCADVYHYFAQRVAIIDDARIGSLLAQPGVALFEGAQGVLLDENYGFAPYTTWSTTTFANAEAILREHDYSGDTIKLGVVRSYATRHGPGPFPTEDAALTSVLPDQHNAWNDWQRTFRVGYFDLVATRYALNIVGHLDYLALTHLDCLSAIPSPQICTAYRYQRTPDDLPGYFEYVADHIKSIIVHSPADLAHQEQLTKRLWFCIPHYQTLATLPGCPHSAERQLAYLKLLEAELNVPIAIASDGPAAADKKCLLDKKIFATIS